MLYSNTQPSQEDFTAEKQAELHMTTFALFNSLVISLTTIKKLIGVFLVIASSDLKFLYFLKARLSWVQESPVGFLTQRSD